MNEAQPKRATFTPKIDGARGEPFDVHFNPSSLEYTITNTLKEGSGKRPTQHVAKSTGKLSMELVFDTTHNGEDVRIHTEKVAKLMEPAKEKGPPPVAHFEWGEYKFAGIVESFKEKIDFFSSDGVPLRAAVSLTLSRQDKVFDSPKNPRTSVGGDLNASEQVAEARVGPRDSVSRLAGRGGDPSAARALAEQNGFESIRAPGAAIVQLSAEVELRPPSAFAGGSASLGIGMGGSLGFGGSADAGLDVDFGAGGSAGEEISASVGGAAGGGAPIGAGGASAGARADLLGSLDLGTTGVGKLRRMRGVAGRATRSSTATHVASGVQEAPSQGSHDAGSGREHAATSAGVPASEGAFDALTEGRGFRRHTALNIESIVRPVEIRGYGTGSGVGFRIGGQATTLGAASVSADVGRNVSLRERIAFDRERGG